MRTEGTLCSPFPLSSSTQGLSALVFWCRSQIFWLGGECANLKHSLRVTFVSCSYPSFTLSPYHSITHLTFSAKINQVVFYEGVRAQVAPANDNWVTRDRVISLAISLWPLTCPCYCHFACYFLFQSLLDALLECVMKSGSNECRSRIHYSLSSPLQVFNCHTWLVYSKFLSVRWHWSRRMLKFSGHQEMKIEFEA